jgi:hypothetical protein
MEYWITSSKPYGKQTRKLAGPYLTPEAAARMTSTPLVKDKCPKGLSIQVEPYWEDGKPYRI